MNVKDDFPEISNQRNEWPRQAQKSNFYRLAFVIKPASRDRDTNPQYDLAKKRFSGAIRT